MIHHLSLETKAVIGVDAKYIIGQGCTGSQSIQTWPAGGGDPLGPNICMLADHSSTGDLSDAIDTWNQIKFFPDHVVESNTIQVEQLND